MAAEHIYDLIIVGAGPAGLTAGIYAGRAALDTLILENETVGGQVTTTSTVYNYPGNIAIDGTKLMHQMQQQVASFDVPIQKAMIDKFDLDSDVKKLTAHNGEVYQARSVILSLGAKPRKVGFPGEEKFRGRGIAYCSTCDGELFKNLQVFVVGGGYSAAEEADYLTRYAKHVTVLVRGDHFKCAPLTAAKALDNPKVDVLYNTEVKQVDGDQYLNSLTMVNNQTGQETVYHVDDGDQTFGVFIYVGTQPETKALQGLVDLDPRGYIKVDQNGATNLPGVFAAGDVVAKQLRQIITAASDGAVAATNAEKYVTEQKQRLGIPIQAKPKPVQVVGETTKLAEEPVPEQPTGNWFNADLIQQMQGVFSRLTKDVTLQILSNETKLSAELESFVTELVKLNNRLHYQKLSAPSDLTYAPQLRLVVDNQDTGVHYAGVPTGHELTSLILGIYNVGSAGQTIEPDLVQRIQQLPALDIKIGVSLTCHFCPDVVAACQKMAALNPHITATMIDLQHFPALRSERQIMSVPATMINDGPVIFGSQSLAELVTAAEQANQG